MHAGGLRNVGGQQRVKKGRGYAMAYIGAWAPYFENLSFSLFSPRPRRRMPLLLRNGLEDTNNRLSSLLSLSIGLPV
jgi:hypothetical protein